MQEKNMQPSFTKLTVENQTLKDKEKVVLNRKGNSLLNEGKIDIAKRIFLTTGYSDGLSRVGDYYYKENNYIEALKMYIVAPAPQKKDELLTKMGSILRGWLKES